MSYFKPKIRKGWKGRKKLFKKIKNHINSSNKTIWFHCASLGEFEQIKPLIEKVYKEFPYYKILLSFFSSSGYEIIKNYNRVHYICYLPLDISKNIRQFIKISQAIALILVKYEFWPNLILETYKKKIPIYSISTIFRKNQIFFKPYGKFMKNILKKITYFFTQEENSKLLLESIGIKCITVSGDTRFDRVIQLKNSFNPLIKIEEFKNNQILIVAGSTWPSDEKILLKWIKKYKNKVKLLLAPHETDFKRISNLESKISMNYILYSKTSNKKLEKYSIMILDSIGLLKYSYGSSDIAYIGGGFQKSGIHNILEAAIFSIPIIFGPIYHKAVEAKDLINYKGAFSINNLENLTIRLNQLIKKNFLRNEMGKNSEKYIYNKKGATEKILNILKQKISKI